MNPAADRGYLAFRFTHPARRFARAVALAGLAVAGLLAAPSWAADMPDGVKKLIPAAKQEEGLLVYGLTTTPRQNAAIEKGLSDYYGFPFRIKLRGGSHNQKAAEIIRAVKNAVPTGIDVFWTSYNISIRLERAGALQKVDWGKAFGLRDDVVLDDYGVRAHDSSLALVVYNTNLIKPADAPRQYEDLLNPQYKRRVVMARTTGVWVFLTRAIGEEKATALLQGLVSKQQVGTVRRNTDVVARVASGEFAVGIAGGQLTTLGKNAPVSYAPVSPIAVAAQGLFVLKDSKSPNLARLWGYWVTTPDGQKTLNDTVNLARVDTKGGELWTLAQKAEVKYLSRAFFAKESQRLAKKYQAIMSAR